MINLDATPFIECTDGDYQPIAIIEDARDVGQSKATKLIENLSKRTHRGDDDVVPAHCVLWTPSDQHNPNSELDVPDIVKFRVREVYPNPGPYVEYEPREWARLLVEMRRKSLPLLRKLMHSKASEVDHKKVSAFVAAYEAMDERECAVAFDLIGFTV